MPQKGRYSTALIGSRFGRLVVISAKGKTRTCLCDCGATIIVKRTSQLTRGNTKSCGCLRVDVTKKFFTTHGATADRKTARAYSIWQTMLQRCNNKNNKKFNIYGGRGIYVCERWLNSYANFLKDMGSPKKGESIDRIDNDGHYCPENCRWATAHQQARNRRNNKRLKYNGETKSLAEWVDILGIPYNTVKSRLNNYGWTVERSFTEGF